MVHITNPFRDVPDMMNLTKIVSLIACMSMLKNINTNDGMHDLMDIRNDGMYVTLGLFLVYLS